MTNSQIKKIRQLHQKKFREEFKLFIAEGPKIVNELLNSDFRLNSIFYTKEFELNKLKVKGEIISEKEMEQISTLTTPNQMLAVFEIPEQGEISFSSKEILLALDDIRDPGNFGTIVRIADWFGMKKIVCSENCVHVYNSKVVQATMGSIARVKVFYQDLETFFKEKVASSELKIYAATMDGKNIYRENFSDGGVILIGNESNGISKNLLQYCSNQITIPRLGQAESLNAAIATAIICSEFTRRQYNISH